MGLFLQSIKTKEETGYESNIDAVMPGRLTQRGDNLTISVDLIDVKNKKTLWVEQFERKMSDLFPIADCRLVVSPEGIRNRKSTIAQEAHPLSRLVGILTS